jgi:hypothetical protein
MNDQDRLEEVERAMREYHRKTQDLYDQMVWELSMRLEVSEDRVRELIEGARA